MITLLHLSTNLRFIRFEGNLLLFDEVKCFYMHNNEATECTIEVLCHNLHPELCVDCISKKSYNTSPNQIPLQTGQMVWSQAGPAWGGSTVYIQVHNLSHTI
ncbi:hypothetical protein ACF0H5_001493 [Mactra antiquata]